MLRWFNLALGLWFFLGALFGCYGALKRSEVLMWIYTIQLGSCLTILLLLTLDFADFAHFLPVPPTAPSTEVVPNIVQKMNKAVEAAESPLKMLHGPGKPVVPSAMFEKPSRILGHHRSTFLSLWDEPLAERIDGSSLASNETAGANLTATAGESIEISASELPKEYQTLKPDLQNVVTAETKGLKHVMKFVFSGVMALGFVVVLYNTWIAFTFASNKW